MLGITIISAHGVTGDGVLPTMVDKFSSKNKVYIVFKGVDK